MSTADNKRRYATRSGFTLLEMVIVIAILAVLAGIAVRGMDGLDQQARFEATQRCMRDINDAVLATGQDADGSLLVSGFVADMGRLPKAIGVDPTTQLEELWSNPLNIQPFAVRPATQAMNPAITVPDQDVLIASGWRGNYLRLGVGQSSLLDGWGQAFDLLKSDKATIVANGDSIAAVRSRGANGAIDSGTTSGYDADVTTSLGTAGPSADPCNVTVSGGVFWLDPGTGQLSAPDPTKGDVVIIYFGPDPATGLPSEQILPIASTSFTSTSGVSYSFPNPNAIGPLASVPVSAGPRVIRAYQGAGLAADPSNCTTATIKSVPVRIMLQPGGGAKDLVLR